MIVNSIQNYSSINNFRGEEKQQKVEEKKEIPFYAFKNLYDDFSVSPYPYVPGKQIEKCFGPVYGTAAYVSDFLIGGFSRNLKSKYLDRNKKLTANNNMPINKHLRVNKYGVPILYGQEDVDKTNQAYLILNMIDEAKAMGANAIIGFAPAKKVWHNLLAGRPRTLLQGIAVKVKDGDTQKDIEQMKQHGLNITQTA